MDAVALPDFLAVLVEPVLVDGMVDDHLELARPRAQLAFVEVGHANTGGVEFVLVEPRLAPVSAEAARVVHEEHVEESGLGVRA